MIEDTVEEGVAACRSMVGLPYNGEPVDQLDRAGEHERVLDALGGIGSRPPTDEHSMSGLFQFPTAGRWWSANRTPLVPGFVT
jgi:hypothetical protein